MYPRPCHLGLAAATAVSVMPHGLGRPQGPRWVRHGGDNRISHIWGSEWKPRPGTCQVPPHPAPSPVRCTGGGREGSRPRGCSWPLDRGSLLLACLSLWEKQAPYGKAGWFQHGLYHPFHFRLSSFSQRHFRSQTRETPPAGLRTAHPCVYPAPPPLGAPAQPAAGLLVSNTLWSVVTIETSGPPPSIQSERQLWNSVSSRHPCCRHPTQPSILSALG